MARRVVDDVAPVLADVEPDVVVYGQFDPGAGVAAARRVSLPPVTPFSPHWPIETAWSTYTKRLLVCAPTAASPLAVTGSWATPRQAVFPSALEVPSFSGLTPPGGRCDPSLGRNRVRAC